MTNKEWKYQDWGNFNVYPFRKKVQRFELGLEYWDSCLGMEAEATADALEVYKALKEYFKGSEYE